MNKYLSQEEKNTLTSEFAYQGKKSGMIGGYCEAGFPLYYANEEMAAMLGYDSVEELAAAIGGKGPTPSTRRTGHRWSRTWADGFTRA